VVPKHRRFETEQSLAPVGAPMRTVDFWPEAVGYGSAAATARRMNGHSRSGPGGNGHAASNGHHSAVADLVPLEEEPWPEWQDWRDWGPPPALHPDHPSAPVPRIELSPDHPSGPWTAPGPRRASDLPQRRPGGPGTARPRSVPPRAPDADDNSGSRRLYAVRGGAPALDNPATRPRAPENFGRHGRTPDGDSLQMAGQVLTRADGHAAEIARRAKADAAAMLEAAERDAAAIRETAQRDAAEMRARLDSMLSELSRVTAYLTESLADPALSAIAPALSATAVAMPAPAPTLPRPRPARVASPPRPTTRSARPGARPATKPAGRQAKVMRKFTAAFAVVSLVGAIAGGSELTLHGLPFFLFRANGAGASEVGPTEPSNPPRAGQPFLPGQQSAAHPKPGAHRKPAANPQPTTTTTTK
jgi:hypothetical protein